MALNSLDLRSAAGMLALQEIPRVGPVTALRVALDEDLGVLPGKRIEPIDLQHAYADARERVARWNDAGLAVVTFFDRAYPERLRMLHEPPPLLWVRGSVELLSRRKLVAIVGTRAPSTFGRTAAERLTGVVAGAGWGVVSGLAKGCDTIAHAESLAAGAPTVAILGGGLDHVYPAQNKELADAIVGAGGALVSEQQLGTRPTASHLVRRDRLQAGLSVALIVCQTAAAGGTLHTVRYAAEQGKPVFCPDPQGSNGKSEGLRVLLDTPAQELDQRLPAWRDARRLCRRLGPQPLAHRVCRDDLGRLLDGLDQALAVDSGNPSGEALRPVGELAAA
jgi:DNA processing protein